MLIINDIDIIQNDTNKKEYQTTDVEQHPQLNNQVTRHSLQSFSTINKNSSQADCPSITSRHTSIVSAQPTLTQLEYETPVPISQINQYNNR
jgi:hypothetical protein